MSIAHIHIMAIFRTIMINTAPTILREATILCQLIQNMGSHTLGQLSLPV